MNQKLELEAIFKRSLPVVRIIGSRGVFAGQPLKHLIVENMPVRLVIAPKRQHLHASNTQRMTSSSDVANRTLNWVASKSGFTVSSTT